MPEGVCGSDWEQVKPSLRRELAAAIDHGGFIYLHGDTGRGKSCAVAALFRSWPGEAWNAKWWDVSEVLGLLMKCKTSHTGGVTITNIEGHSEEIFPHKIERGIRNAELVVFDEIGLRSTPSEPQQEALTRLVNLRAGKSTIFTSNVSDLGLNNIYHPRLVSRITCGTVIEATGDDLRAEGTRYRKA